jgi:hypothetical protein
LRVRVALDEVAVAHLGDAIGTGSGVKPRGIREILSNIVSMTKRNETGATEGHARWVVEQCTRESR